MRMKDSPDYLTIKFANPSTGLVSPSATSAEITAAELRSNTCDRIAEEGRREEVAQAKSWTYGARWKGVIEARGRGGKKMAKAVEMEESSRAVSVPAIMIGEEDTCDIARQNESDGLQYPELSSDQSSAYQKTLLGAKKAAQALERSFSPLHRERPNTSLASESSRSISANEEDLHHVQRTLPKVSRKAVSSSTTSITRSYFSPDDVGMTRSSSVPTPRKPGRPVFKRTAPAPCSPHLDFTPVVPCSTRLKSPEEGSLLRMNEPSYPAIENVKDLLKDKKNIHAAALVNSTRIRQRTFKMIDHIWHVLTSLHSSATSLVNPASTVAESFKILQSWALAVFYVIVIGAAFCFFWKVLSVMTQVAGYVLMPLNILIVVWRIVHYGR
ncbi:MAG: hypothetical protein M1827_003994 [Pycnora praestabilis]|nr:MAG: hypothetical protein M1827_003994 [Pycnora praestabilis]